MSTVIIIFAILLAALVLYSIFNVVWHLPQILGFGPKKN
jgi:hypothetical protein